MNNYLKSLHAIIRFMPFLTLLIILLGACSLRLASYPLLPAIFLIPVFYWLVFRPDLLPLWALLILGLLYDSLLGYDLGISSFLLMLSSLICDYARHYLNPHRFILIWGAYSLYSFVYILVYGLLLSGGFALFVSWVYGIVLYPLLAGGLSHLHLRIQRYV